MSTYTAIIFDFFDVIHSDPFHIWLKAHDLVREGAQAAASRAVDTGEIDMSEFYRRLGLVTDQSADAVKAEFVAAASIDRPMLDLVAELKPHYDLAVLSNAASDYLRAIIREHDLEPLFDHIVISSEIGYAKPDPEMFQHTLEKLTTTPDHAIFIDNNPKNVAAAEKLGLTGIVFMDSASLRAALHQLQIS